MSLLLPLGECASSMYGSLTRRFSQEPRVALPHIKPEAYGDVFYERANTMLGNVFRLPLIETVIGCVLLAACAGGCHCAPCRTDT